MACQAGLYLDISLINQLMNARNNLGDTKTRGQAGGLASGGGEKIYQTNQCLRWEFISLDIN